MRDLLKNPYRLFFVIGTLGLFIGLGVWIVFGLFNPEFYKGQLHAHYMIGVFLLSYFIGFLMTAVPRMSGTPIASPREMLVQLIPLLLGAFFGVFENQEKYFFFCVVLTLLVLFFFCGRRILSCPGRMPDVFPMVILSLLSGLLGSLFILLDEAFLGNRLFYLNLILGLCVGVGARLIPSLMRLGHAPSYLKGEMWVVGLLLMLACFLEGLWSEPAGNGLRCVIILLVMFRYWRIHKFDGQNTCLGIGVRFAALSIFSGTLGLWLFPDYRLEALHLLYVSGFALLTLMVASRVILSHGNYDLNLEIKSWFIWLPVALIVLAAATRVSAVFVPGGYERHLAYASFSFLVGVIFWGSFFIPKLVLEKKNNSSKIRLT